MEYETSIPNEIHGLFSYLNLVLESALFQKLGEIPASDFERRLTPFNSPIAEIERTISRDFNLTRRNSGIKLAISRFRLYSENDIIHALSRSYCRYRRGESPIDALNADYCVEGFGVLRWATSNDDKRAELLMDTEPGDRYVAFSTLASRGLLLVRGDRLVKHITEVSLSDPQPSPIFQANLSRFEMLGGSRAFLRGDFE